MKLPTVAIHQMDCGGNLACNWMSMPRPGKGCLSFLHAQGTINLYTRKKLLSARCSIRNVGKKLSAKTQYEKLFRAARMLSTQT